MPIGKTRIKGCLQQGKKGRFRPSKKGSRYKKYGSQTKESIIQACSKYIRQGEKRRQRL